MMDISIQCLVAGGSTGRLAVITFLCCVRLDFFFVTYFYVTLAGCRIILHATRRATLLVASVMLRLHAAASSCTQDVMLRLHAAASSCTQHVMLRLHAAASSLRNTFFSPSLLFSRSCVLWSRQHNSDYVCLGAMVTSIFLVSYNFT